MKFRWPLAWRSTLERVKADRDDHERISEHRFALYTGEAKNVTALQARLTECDRARARAEKHEAEAIANTLAIAERDDKTIADLRAELVGVRAELKEERERYARLVEKMVAPQVNVPAPYVPLDPDMKASAVIRDETVEKLSQTLQEREGWPKERAEKHARELAAQAEALYG